MTGTTAQTTAAPAPPASLAPMIHEIVAGVALIAGHQRCTVGRRLLRQGISMTHLQVLWLLLEHGDLSVSHLADFLGVAVPNATGLVDRMEQRGLVERIRVRDDRRLVMVRPTSAGRAVVEEIDGWRVELMEALLGRLDRDQLERLAQGVRDIRAALLTEIIPATPKVTPGPAFMAGSPAPIL